MGLAESPNGVRVEKATGSRGNWAEIRWGIQAFLFFVTGPAEVRWK